MENKERKTMERRLDLFKDYLTFLSDLPEELNYAVPEVDLPKAKAVPSDAYQIVNRMIDDCLVSSEHIMILETEKLMQEKSKFQTLRAFKNCTVSIEQSPDNNEIYIVQNDHSIAFRTADSLLTQMIEPTVRIYTKRYKEYLLTKDKE